MELPHVGCYESKKADQRGLARRRRIDRKPGLAHCSDVKSLLEIEEAIAQLPSEARKQLVQDMPALCPDAFPPDGWRSILQDPTPRTGLSSLMDKLDAEYQLGSHTEFDRQFPI